MLNYHRVDRDKRMQRTARSTAQLFLVAAEFVGEVLLIRLRLHGTRYGTLENCNGVPYISSENSEGIILNEGLTHLSLSRT